MQVPVLDLELGQPWNRDDRWSRISIPAGMAGQTTYLWPRKMAMLTSSFRFNFYADRRPVSERFIELHEKFAPAGDLVPAVLGDLQAHLFLVHHDASTETFVVLAENACHDFELSLWFRPEDREEMRDLIVTIAARARINQQTKVVQAECALARAKRIELIKPKLIRPSAALPGPTN